MHITMHTSFSSVLSIAVYFVVSVFHVSGFTYGVCEVLTKRDQSNFFCYKKNLAQVPQKFPLHLTNIDISQNRIKKINSGDFQNLTSLQILNISYNSISYIGKGAFKDLMSLTKLDLSGNHLTRITKDLFHGLNNLTALFLKKNKISAFEKSSFSTFEHLESLTLTDNKLMDMKSMQSIFRIKGLKEIHIAYNNISVFQSIDISNSSLTLKTLNLAHNPLKIFRFTADIFPYLHTIDLSYCFSSRSLEWDVQNTSFFKAVKQVDLAGINISVMKSNVILQTFNNSLAFITLNSVNPVKSLINSSCQIPTISNLTLRDNKIRSLEGAGLEKCFHIKALDLHRNSLTNLENVFASLKNLTSLKLGYNKFAYIPNMMQNLLTLESLNFVFNQIEALDCSTFKNLNNLNTLQLYGNIINVVKECVFRDLMNLKYLFLGSNCIKFLKGAFKNGPEKLEVLDLGSNSLVSITNDDLRGLKSLKSLFLNDNKINLIHDGAFGKLVSLRLLVLESNKITDKSLRPAIFSELSNLTTLFMQNNYILRTNRILSVPPFYHLASLKSLYVFSQRNHNKLSFLPSNLLRNLTCLNSFWANNVGFTNLPDDLFKDNTELSVLALNGNDLTVLSPDVFRPLQKLDTLYLKETRLKSLDFLIQANLQNLYYLQVSNNQITSINDTIVKSLPGLRILDMKGNTFTCDCSNAWLVKWIEEGNLTQLLVANKYECNTPPDLKQTKLLHLDVHSCSVDIEFYCYISSMSLVLLTLVISLIYHFLHWQIVYAYHLFLAFLYDKQKGSYKSLGFQYDAFVSYNTLDELWVINELLPKLEGEQGWRLCLHHRDFQPGKPIVDNIVDGIYSSRKTICVVSQHYLESEWCSREVQVASFRLFDEKKDVLILVFLEDIPVYRLSPYYRMRGLVKKRTYLSWPKAGQDTRVFWEKLRVALGARGGTEEENSLSDVQNALGSL